MADRRHIEAMVKRKEQEIEGLETQIKEAKIYLQALADVLKRFPREASEDADPDSSALRAGSMVAQAREAILKVGAPIHVERILKEMGKEPTRENKTGLSGSLAAYVRKGSIFTRPAPNTFGLVELAKRREGTTEPPADFGVEKSADEEIPF